MASDSSWTAGRAGYVRPPQGLIDELAFLERIPTHEWSREALPAGMRVAMLFHNGVIGFAETAGEAPFVVYAEIAKVYGHIMIGWLPR